VRERERETLDIYIIDGRLAVVREYCIYIYRSVCVCVYIGLLLPSPPANTNWPYIGKRERHVVYIHIVLLPPSPPRVSLCTSPGLFMYSLVVKYMYVMYMYIYTYI